VIVTNTKPGATVSLIVTRSGTDLRVGHKVARESKETITLDPGVELVARDLVNAMQELAGDKSPASTDGPEVQVSVAQFDAVEVLSHLRQCSRGFFLGGMRPGTQVQILQGGSVIGNGEAIDGTAFISVPNGLPAPGASLTARQVICPKPPPSPPSSAYIFDSALPSILLFPFQRPQTVPAPAILQGLTACSRAVQIGSIQPGADVILEGARGWWASLGPSDQTSAWLPLPVELEEGEDVTIRHEVAPHCELTFERKHSRVAPQQKLGKPSLYQIDCNTSPTMYISDLKPEADVEISVYFAGAETIYRTQATESSGPIPPPLPAPPMPVHAVVKARQGECNLWSDWSDTQTANALTAPPQKPKISHELFSCQDALPVENIWPLSGFLQVLSKRHGELNRVFAFGNIVEIPVSPSFTSGDDVWVEHHVCGFSVPSDVKHVQPPGRNVVAGTLKSPLFDGDTTVVLNGAVAGARIECWEQTRNQLLFAGRAPFSDTGVVDVNISGFGALRAGWSVFVKTSHCGQYVQTASVLVVFRAPVLNSISPVSVESGHAAFTLTVQGSNFLSGAKVQWNGGDRPTTFISNTVLHASITAADVSTVKTNAVRVVNPDGQSSAAISFNVTAPPPAKLQLSVIDKSGGNFSLTSVTWTVWQQTISGFTVLASNVTGQSAAVQPTASGQYHIHADVLAERLSTGEVELAEFRGTASGPGGAATLVIVWSMGVSQSRTFRLIAEGIGGGLYNPVVEL
jgi:hypothetical protein